jgi:hypothetical protein
MHSALLLFVLNRYYYQHHRGSFGTQERHQRFIRYQLADCFDWSIIAQAGVAYFTNLLLVTFIRGKFETIYLRPLVEQANTPRELSFCLSLLCALLK